VALLLVLGSSAYAQNINCVANTANPTTVRAEGVTELTGDAYITCTGGSPTAAGVAVPLYTITILLNTNVTSRLMNGSSSGGGVSEAVLAIDDPYPTGPLPATATRNSSTVPPPGGTLPGTPQLGCVANSQTACPTVGTGGGYGIGGPYNGGTGFPNVFQGTWSPALPQAITWAGVPIDAPGSNVRTIRITNVRANACQLGVSSTLIPAQITELITITGSQTITLQQPQPTVAVVLPGLTVSNKSATFQQCVTLNNQLINPTATAVGITNAGIAITATEGFPAAFKVRNFSQYFANNTVGGAAATPANPSPSSGATGFQNVFGFAYNAESGYVANTPNLINVGTGNASGAIVLADSGTELSYAFAGVPNGVSIFVPNTIYLYPTTVTGVTAATGTAGATGVAVLLGSSGAGTTALTINGGAVNATYEVLLSAPNTQEFAFLAAQVAFVSNTATNLPGITTSGATVAVNFAPLSTVPTAATSSVPIPRFCQTHVPNVLFNITACTCDLLFPFVTNQAGYDTGVAIANTSLDPFKTPTQSGNVVLNYYGSTTGGGAAPAAATTTSVVAAGAELVFTLSGGGTNGIAATPGFQGYIIAVAAFQYCHGFAFITNGLGTSSGIAEGYLAIQLDQPFWAVGTGATGTRTGNVGESQGQ